MTVIEVGATIGAYRMVRQLGAGGMGVVWQGEHAMLGRPAAIKLLHPEFSSRPDIVTRFFNEARAATAISDHGIVQVFDFGHHSDGTAYIVMEMLDGESLERRLRRSGSLAVGQTLRLMRQVATSLGAAHARGIVHRDLKPDNIYVIPDGEVAGGERTKILDFGIAKLAGEPGAIRTQTSAVMGTPVFMSPEQCRGAGQVDQRSDIYSLGCMMFLLISGRPPFDAEGAGDLIAMHLREVAPLLSSRVPTVPREVDQLIARCLAKDPSQRFDSGTALAAALEPLVERLSTLPGAARPGGLAVVASAPTTLSSASSEVTPKPQQRARLAVIAGVAVATVALVVLVFVSRGNAHHAASLAAPAAVVPDAPPVKAELAVEPKPLPDAAVLAPEASVAAPVLDAGTAPPIVAPPKQIAHKPRATQPTHTEAAHVEPAHVEPPLVEPPPPAPTLTPPPPQPAISDDDFKKRLDKARKNATKPTRVQPLP